ncbi:dTDP-4-dehydrorhamnose 3,5-epimerase [Candidatus Microgenomates bacterium]|nr:dTDP-4-dehydrorhamnose 3,5-epimerase [Candidatus Microgenomates bacterium]
MKFTKEKIDGALSIQIEPRGDERGFFARMFCTDEFKKQGVDFTPVQMNNSTNTHKGTIRGLHFQTGEHAEAKLFRCIRGSIFSVAVDLRKDSPTYKQWMGITLSADERNMVYYPAGCACGYQALEDGAEVIYMVSTPYFPGVEGGIRYNDPQFAIQWPIVSDIIVSDKDSSLPDFVES